MGSRSPFQPVIPDVRLSKLEEETLTFWDQEKIFERTLAETKGRKPFSFYDGPPFATGLPHYGHLLAGTIKDIVPRYWTMRGHHVPRRFGWDCHGLPVEYEIDKSLKITSRKDVFAMGVDRYNEACRSIVLRYTEEWKKTVRRMGRWVDMDHPYHTMDPAFMQSVWWVFGELWKKDLVYEGYKVVPYSTGCSTPLSNFEAGLNYKDVQDPALTVAFRLKEEDAHLLAWTTTPWTLPSNLALAVHRDHRYARVKEKSTGRTYYLAAELVPSVFKDPEEISTEGEVKGSHFLGLAYEPLFPYFSHLAKEGAFKVIHSDHVTLDAGTGIVHMAPAFGEDDFFACQKNGVPIVNPVDDDGMFTQDVPDFAGKRVKEADPAIIKMLKSRGSLLRHDTITHSYPFCWRSDTPLIYRAVSTWFVRVEKIKETMMAANRETRWVPGHLRDGRFGNWLENARDWAISRNRFWGTPIPIWRNPEGETKVITSADELSKLSGKPVSDLHIHHVDRIEIPASEGGSPLKRIEGVFDCWFESGSMPYAQGGYPFTGKEGFEQGFPADFIAEGLDQTRGWFYTLTVIGAALFGKSPFKNVIVNGIITAEDGKKMSKSLRNYPDPNLLINEHGADAVRLYLIDSPVVRAQELRFSEKGVKEVVRRILLRWWNAYSFFVNYAEVDGFHPPTADPAPSRNLLDQWLLSRLHSLIHKTRFEMERYELSNVVPHLLRFIEELTNTYIRFNRRHFWSDGMPQDKREAYETLYEVLFDLCRVMAPFTPFLSDTIYRNLISGVAGAKPSVHLTFFPDADLTLVKPELEEAVERMEQLVLMARNLREELKIKTKIPLRTLTVIHRDPAVLEELKKLEPYFTDELNVREVKYDTAEENYVEFCAKANFPVLGKRLGPKMKEVAAAIARLPRAELEKLELGGSLPLAGETILREEIEIRRGAKAGVPHLAAHALLAIQVDPTVTPEQIQEGLAREALRRVQIARKNAALKLDDRIDLAIECDEETRKAVETHLERVKSEALALSFRFGKLEGPSYGETFDLDGDSLAITLRKAKP